MPELDAAYWSNFWIERGQESVAADRQAQVLRTTNGKPIEDESFQPILDWVLLNLELCPTDDVLDLCCGNGIFSLPIAERCRSVYGVDVSFDFVSSIEASERPNITTLASDIRNLDFPAERFDRVLLYAGIQYFSLSEAYCLIANIWNWLRPNGVLLLGDVPDLENRWAFFRTTEQRRNYFDSLAAGKPIIGTWFQFDWLRFAGDSAGFSNCELLRQPEGFPYAHFRYDVRLRKSE